MANHRKHRVYLRANVADAVAPGWSNDALAAKISESYGFSKERAMVDCAHGNQPREQCRRAVRIQGERESWAAREWLTAEDDKVSPDG